MNIRAGHPGVPAMLLGVVLVLLAGQSEAFLNETQANVVTGTLAEINPELAAEISLAIQKELAERRGEEEEESMDAFWEHFCYWTCIKTPASILFHGAQFCFFFGGGCFCDTVFIRIFIAIGVTLITLWTMLGVPDWNQLYNPFVMQHGLPLDPLVWGLMCIAVNIYPLTIQLQKTNDGRIIFKQDKWIDETELMWRVWYTRTGITREGFKLITDHGEWVHMEPGETLPTMDASGDRIHYYCAGGMLRCTIQLPPGKARQYGDSFNILNSQFVQSTQVLALLGQPTPGVQLTQSDFLTTVESNSTYVPAPDSESLKLGFEKSTHPIKAKAPKKGALVFRWKSKDMIKMYFASLSGYAMDAMRMLLSQSTIERFYSELMDEQVKQDYYTLFYKRLQLEREKYLPIEAASTRKNKPFCQQCRDAVIVPGTVGQKERAVNAVFVGSRDGEELQQVMQRVQESDGIQLSEAYKNSVYELMYGSSLGRKAPSSEPATETTISNDPKAALLNNNSKEDVVVNM